MASANIWQLLEIIAIISLLVSFYIGRNAIWGGFILGLIICLIITLINIVSASQIFNWNLFRKIVTIAILTGTLFEIVSKVLFTRSSEKKASNIMENLAKAKIDFEMIQSENISPASKYYRKAKKKYQEAELRFKRLLESKAN